MLPDRENSLCAIIGQLINPAIREIQDFISYYKTFKFCRALYNMNYNQIYYYLNKLKQKGRIISLLCENGYKRRYTIKTIAKKHKQRLDSCIMHIDKRNNAIHFYRIGTREIKIDCNRSNNQKMIINGDTILVIYDRRLSRYYIVVNNIFLGVIRRGEESIPRLPGSTYRYGTEYSRCIRLFKQMDNHHILCLVGHRRATGSRLA